MSSPFISVSRIDFQCLKNGPKAIQYSTRAHWLLPRQTIRYSSTRTTIRKKKQTNRLLALFQKWKQDRSQFPCKPVRRRQNVQIMKTKSSKRELLTWRRVLKHHDRSKKAETKFKVSSMEFYVSCYVFVRYVLLAVS